MRSDESKFNNNNNKVSRPNDLFTSQILLPLMLIIDIVDLHPEQRLTGNHLVVTWSGHDRLESVCVTSIRKKPPTKSHQQLQLFTQDCSNSFFSLAQS